MPLRKRTLYTITASQIKASDLWLTCYFGSEHQCSSVIFVYDLFITQKGYTEPHKSHFMVIEILHGICPRRYCLQWKKGNKHRDYTLQTQSEQIFPQVWRLQSVKVHLMLYRGDKLVVHSVHGYSMYALCMSCLKWLLGHVFMWQRQLYNTRNSFSLSVWIRDMKRNIVSCYCAWLWSAIILGVTAFGLLHESWQQNSQNCAREISQRFA